MNKINFRQIAILLATLATVTINILANALPLNGQNTGEISDRFPVFFVPAGYVFSIWGLIYIGLLAYAVYQALPAQRDNPRLKRIGGWYLLGSLANSAWIFLWHYEYFGLTLAAMLTLLISLIAIYLSLEIGRGAVSTAERWLARGTFSVYLGWITVATIANLTDVLYLLDWNGWGVSPQVWAVIMLTAGVIIGSLVALTRGDAAYLLVLVWAFAGIGVKQASAPLVANAAWAAALFVAALVGLTLWRGLRSQNSPVFTGS